MKITRAELKSIINEVLSEVADSDKFTKALETLNKKAHAQNVALQQTRVTIAKVKVQQASDAVDAAESSGNNSGNEQDALKKAKEAEENAKNGVTAAENNLKAAQQGGSAT